MKVLVCGGRSLDENKVSDYLAKTLAHMKVDKIIHGNAPGADKGAEKFAVFYGIEWVAYQADWGNLDAKPLVLRMGRQGPYNAAAGAIRNKLMLDKEGDIDLIIIAFPGGPGTMDMIKQSKRGGYPVICVPDNGQFKKDDSVPVPA